MRGISCQFFIYITKNTPSARVRYPFGGEKGKNREIKRNKIKAKSPEREEGENIYDAA